MKVRRTLEVEEQAEVKIYADSVEDLEKQIDDMGIDEFDWDETDSSETDFEVISKQPKVLKCKA